MTTRKFPQGQYAYFLHEHIQEVFMGPNNQGSGRHCFGLKAKAERPKSPKKKFDEK